jgi:flagellum-specific peptidoglycan hydrolase FlgJ
MKKLIAFLIIGIWIYWINIGFEDKDYPIIITLPEIDTIELVEIESQEVYAGRTDTAIALYDSIGLPINRKWLTSNERKARHLRDSSSKMRNAFKAWRKQYMQNFIKEWGKHAVVESKTSKVPASIIVAQAILESNWGLSKLAVTANNYFGHKYRGTNKASFIVAADDSPTDKFTKYRSKWWCLRHHTNILNGMYKRRLKQNNCNGWLESLCGCITIEQSKEFVDNGGMVYATSCFKGDICYSEKLLKIIKRYNLHELD